MSPRKSGPKSGAKSTSPKPGRTKPGSRAPRGTPAGAAGENSAQTGDDLLARLVTAPVVADRPTAQARLNDWLTEQAASGRVLRTLIDGEPKLAALLEGVVAHSPYLWGLASAAPERLLRVLRSDPDIHLDALLAGTVAAVRKAKTEAEVMALLRRMKAEAALLIALADIGGVWPVMRATHALTELADTAVSCAVDFLLATAAREGKFLPPDPKNPARGSGYVVLAMGKMGAFELNYSSDIDLIVFYDPDKAPLAADIEPAPFFVRVTQRLARLLQERTIDGYVFRTDLRLRPDPASTAIAISVPTALTYYESAGRNWERAAMIKARACAGDLEAAAGVLDALTPFIWRKYLDFAAVADVQAMKQQIHAFRGHGEIAIEGHNIKLGRGGIREIEFFAQTQQLIAGGRNPVLRDRETLVTLDRLAEGGWIDAKARDDLAAAYRFLRTVEHRLQMVNDEQTQTLPDDRADVEHLARFLGFAGRDAFAADLRGHMERVQQHYSRLLEAAPGGEQDALEFPADSDDRKTLDRLLAMGFRAPLQASAGVRQWLAGGYRSLRAEAVRAQLRDLLPVLLEQIARTENPDATLLLFDRFLANLSAPARLLSLLRQNPSLIALVATILGTAPRLADTLARYPQVIDALVDPGFFGSLPDETQLAGRLGVTLSEARFDEDLLERIRMFGLEYMFLIGVRILTGTVTAAQAGEAYGRLADVVIRAVHGALSNTFAEAHGHLKDEATAVLAMGKLGGYEMTASSDLDLILIYDFDEAYPDSDGRRPLYGGQYFARLTQRLINALTAQTNYGALYEVDMRLRPSGRSGPVATKLDGFASYQETEAWTWEHMALTRARVVSATPAFAMRVNAVIREVLQRPRDAALIAGDVVEMRGAIAKEKGDSDPWDIKYARGGLVDIEFVAQYLQLVHAERQPGILDTSTARVLDKARRLGVLAPQDAEALRPAVRLYHNLTQVLRLCLAGPFDPKIAGPDLLRLLARAADVPDFATLEATLTEAQAKVREAFVRILGDEPKTQALGANRI